jgi:hypothetical protein
MNRCGRFSAMTMYVKSGLWTKAERIAESGEGIST